MPMTERELVFTRRLVKLEATLELMRNEAMYGQLTNDPNWGLYSCAADCVEKELIKVRREII